MEQKDFILILFCYIKAKVTQVLILLIIRRFLLFSYYLLNFYCILEIEIQP